MASLAKGEALHRMHVLAELGIFPNYFTKLRSVLSQRYSGDITILPEISYANFPKVLQNPSTEFMLQAMLSGERATWPKLSRIQNHCAIELALDMTVQQLRSRIVFSPSQVDLRLGSLTMSSANRAVAEPRGRSRKSMINTRHRPSNDVEVESSHSPPQRPISYFEIRSKEPFMGSNGKTLSLHMADELPVSSAVKISPADLLSSSAEDDQADANPFSEDTDESSASYSDNTPPNEPSRPTLWPSTRQVFPSATAPNTPFLTSRLSSSCTNMATPQVPASLSITPKADPRIPSSPEQRYKQLFHNHVAPSLATQAAPDIFLQAAPESGNTCNRAVDFADENNEIEEMEGKKMRSRSGSNTTLVLDISGTRGMMLRRRRSLSTGMKGIMPPGPR